MPPRNARGDEEQCPVAGCGKWRSKRAMWQHIITAHDPAALEQARVNGAMSRGQSGEPWWRRMLKRKGL